MTARHSGPRPGRITLADWRVIILASLGGALEFYDFVIYSMFAEYIAAAFFPARDPLVSLMFAFAVFAVGYLARPVGGMVLSHFGDKYGRRPVFIAAILAMSLSTVCMGLLPSYAQWGVVSSILMILLRLTQGFCLGGELPGAVTYVVETAPQRGGFVGGVVFFCVNSGVGLASLLTLGLHESLSPADVAGWGWRIGFLVGGLLGLLSFWLRLSLEETKAFEKMRGARSSHPLVELLRTHPWQILVGIAGAACTGTFNGMLFAIPAFFTRVDGYTPVLAIEAQNVCLLVLSLLMLPMAWLGDQIPRRWVLGAGALAAALLSVPFFQAAATRQINPLILFALAGLVAAFFNGSFAGMVADLFPTRIRFSGIAVVLNVSFSIFSGLTPLVTTVLAATVKSPAGPGFFMASCFLLSVISAFFQKRYGGHILADAALQSGHQASG